ncbi:MAG: alpha-glucosidase [Candidatus Cloacimonetes bacterium]|nr:alpha-glucosidase [Candidatus Cloacimonadota bacterium]
MKAFRSGKPFSTGAVVEKPAKFLSKLEISGFKIKVKDVQIILTRRLAPDDIVLGLGEQLGGINRRGRKYITYCTDTPVHIPEQLSLYGAHPFIIIKGRINQGLFIDYAGEIIFDVGFTDKDFLEITITSTNLELYYWKEKLWQTIVTSYLELTGGVYVPPRWAFGYQQCRWSYPDAPKVTEIAGKFRQLGIPCDAIYLDIDYMDNYKVFTVDEQKFPEFKEFVGKMKKQGFHLIPIIDPGVKIEDGYQVYEEGKANHHFCTDINNEDFQAAVWPGLTHLPDFTRPETRKWWGELYDNFIEMGIEGFWNDMNEPAIFYTDYEKEKIFAQLQSAADAGKIKDINLIHLQWEIKNFHNNREDYRRIYHHPSPEQTVWHDDIHNLYGAKMALAFAEHVQEKYPERRFLIFSRSSYSGSQRYSGIWYGDNKSWWEHLEGNIKMLVNANLVGYFYSGADIGGFGDNCHSELMLRWLQLSVFSPLMRNHAAIGTRQQELWEFDQQTLNQSRNIIRLRYALLPWLYSQYLEYAGINKPLIRPLMWDFEDAQSADTEDQFIYGDGIMVAPIYHSNSRGRNVYLPESRWLAWNVRSWEERDMQILNPGNHYLECPLEKQLVFLRENTLIALQEPEEFVGQRNPDTLFITGLVTEQANLKILADQGSEPAYSGISVLEIDVENKNDYFIIKTKTVKKQQLPWKHVVCEIYDLNGNTNIIHKDI